jgi:hypothetical protein
MFYQLTSEIQDEGIAEIIKYDEGCNSIIEKWDLNLDLKRTLQWYRFGSEVNVGPTLYSVQQIVDNEKQMNNLNNGLLLIGVGPNGDELFLNSKSLEVLFWNHEEAEDYNSRKIFDCIKLYNHVLSLLVNIRNRNFIPWDSFAADEYYQIYKGI